MSNIMRISPSFDFLPPTRSACFSWDPLGFSRCSSGFGVNRSFLVANSRLYLMNSVVIGGGNVKALAKYSHEGAVQGLDSSPVSVELEPIAGASEFDRVISEAQQREVPVVIVWMANWCRKCIYLKPKLEKLAADYYPRIRFYCIDVNNAPYKLVQRAEVTRMPTIQLWRDCKKQTELIGGHKAYLVVNEVHKMIENESTT